MNTDDDPLARRLKQLAGDPLTEEEAASQSAQFAAALRRLATDPDERARIDAIAREASHDGPPPADPSTDEDTDFDVAAGLHDLVRRIDQHDATTYHDTHRSNPVADTQPTGTESSDKATPPEDPPAPGSSRPGPRSGEYQVYLPRGGGHGRWFTLTNREWAADILSTVAEAILHGAWPRDVTVFDLGRALRRAAGNADYLQTEQNSGRPPDAPVSTSVRKAVNDAALEEFLQGWHAANSDHGPISRDDHGARAGVTPEYWDYHPEGAPPGARMRSRKTGRLWWVTEHGEWTDGLTVCSSWKDVCRRERLLFPDE